MTLQAHQYIIITLASLPHATLSLMTCTLEGNLSTLSM